MFSKLGQSLTAREILDLVRTALKQGKGKFSLEWIPRVGGITSITQFFQAGGGKRWRRTRLLLGPKIFGPTTETGIRLAAVVEMIHTATLVHDDVIDYARTRRGRPSINVVWGNHTSVLAGDWLYMQAFQIALRQRNFHVLDVLIGLTQAMVEGELLQLERIGKIEVTEADYMELVDRKTACLFSACARLGAVVGGADEATENRMSEFGWNLGIAFQLVDDVLDFTSREKILGKPVGNDLREGKVTLPLIYALQEATAEERKLIDTVLAEGNYESVPFLKILQMIRKYRGIERAMERAQSFTDKARAQLLEFQSSKYQRALLAVTDLVTERDH